MLAKADKPDETRDQLSEGSHEAFVLPPHSFNYKKIKTKNLLSQLVFPQTSTMIRIFIVFY